MWSSAFIAWWNAWNALCAFKSSLGFWIGHYKPDFNRLKTRCDKQFDTGPLLISAICKEARLNGIAQQNGSVWLRPCQSTHKKHSTGENKQPLISSESPQSLGKAAKTRHQLLSAGNLLWTSEGRERKRVGLKGDTRQKSGKKRFCCLPQQCFIPHTRHSLKNGGGETHPKTSLPFIYAM